MSESTGIAAAPNGAETGAGRPDAGDAPVRLPELLRMRRAITAVKRGETQLLISKGGRPVRVSTAAAAIMPLLLRGATLEMLQAELRARHPRARDVDPKVRAFVTQLYVSGLLEGSGKQQRAGPPRVLVPGVDALGARLASIWLVLPGLLRRGVGGGLILGALAAVIAAYAHPSLRPHLSDVRHHFSWLGLALFAFVVVPLHELGHAVACRRAGVAVREAGVLVLGRFLPVPFVDTTGAYAVQDRRRRAWIPAMGPVVDLLAAGAAASVLLATSGGGTAGEAARTLLLISSMFVFFDSSLFTPSDGSHVAEALLGDELARVAGLTRERHPLVDPDVGHRYRLLLVLYLSLFVLFVVFLALP
jgi:putative peptide zinc metalloprotease protein